MPDSERRTRDLRFLETCLPNVAQIFHYWDARRGNRRMPCRADLDPVDIPRLLAGILLIDVEGVDDDGIGIYRYRVVGTREVQSRGHDPTGRLVVEGYFAETLQEAIATYELVRRDGCFLFEPLRFWSEDKHWVDEDSIALPLSEDGETVTQILVYSEQRRPSED